MDSQGIQSPEIIKLSWEEIYSRIGRFPSKGSCYGVPRGGAIVAGLTGRAVGSPWDADFIVDDIIDSGRTRDTWSKRHPGKPFFALVDKTNGDKAGWYHFMWETPPDQDVEENVVRILEFLGEDPKREGLVDTPKRVVKAWREMTAGYHQDPGSILGADFHGNGYDQMIVCRNVEFVSTCEHHMLAFQGVAHIAYVPGERVVGLSKMARLVDCFARRLQIQEKLTQQVAQAMEEHLRPKGVGVTMRARHSCMSCRGVMKQRAEMVTTALTGVFRDQVVREEFLFHCGER